MLIHGECDPLPIEAPKAISNYLPQAKMIVFSNCGHFIFIERAEETFQSIHDFLASPDKIPAFSKL